MACIRLYHKINGQIFLQFTNIYFNKSNKIIEIIYYSEIHVVHLKD